jgi:hypothetical protein
MDYNKMQKQQTWKKVTKKHTETTARLAIAYFTVPYILQNLQD